MIILKKDCICPKECSKIEDGVFYVKKNDEWIEAGKGYPNCCPICGLIFPYVHNQIKQYLMLRGTHKLLKDSLKLFFISQHEAAVRDAIIVLEEQIRKLSKIKNETGYNLAEKAFSFEVDKATKVVTKKPKVAINKLRDTSEQNEQNGLRFMLMGFFQGIRNIYQHHKVHAGFLSSLDIILQVSFFLEAMEGERCLTNGCQCPHCKEIYKSMKEKKQK